MVCLVSGLPLCWHWSGPAACLSVHVVGQVSSIQCERLGRLKKVMAFQKQSANKNQRSM